MDLKNNATRKPLSTSGFVDPELLRLHGAMALVPAALIFSFYFLSRAFLFDRIDSHYWFASYLFELLFVAGIWALYRKRVWFNFIPDRTVVRDGVIVFFVGFFIFLGISSFDVPVPIPLEDGKAVFLLLTVSPMLEEGIFRLALWFPLLVIFEKRNPAIIIAVSSLLFALSHLPAARYVPEEYVSFVVIQTFYTLGLGSICAYWMYRTSSLMYPMFFHFLFNLGFYVGFLA